MYIINNGGRNILLMDIIGHIITENIMMKDSSNVYFVYCLSILINSSRIIASMPGDMEELGIPAGIVKTKNKT